MSRRDQITLSDDEVLTLLGEERVVTCASFGPHGWPHLMPLWYVVRGGTLWAWTYAKSQKVRNLERDARCTLQVEAGRDVYHELRGVMLKCVAAIHRDPEIVVGVGNALAARYGGGGHVTPEQAAKRVALQFVVKEIVSFDHSKI